MKRITFLILIIVFLAGCTNRNTSYYGDLIDEIEAYQVYAELPKNIDEIQEKKSNFDVNNYFEFCKHIKPIKGYKADYIYYKDFLTGYPVIYTYNENNKPEIDYNKIYSIKEGELITKEMPIFFLENRLLDYVEMDGSKQGYLEYAVLDKIGEQFLLYWHACYNEHVIVESKNQLNSILKRVKNVDDEFKEKATKLQIKPVYKYDDNVLKLSILCFSDWTGFFNEIYYFDKQNKQFIRKETELLIKYDCGVIY